MDGWIYRCVNGVYVCMGVDVCMYLLFDGFIVCVCVSVPMYG